MKRIAFALAVILFLSFPVFSASSVEPPHCTVTLEAPVGNPTIDALGNLVGRVRFVLTGEGKTAIWGRFIVDGQEGPTYFKTLMAPSPEPIIFETFLPTSLSGSHEIYFELISPNESKTSSTTYIVNPPKQDISGVKIISPINGQIINQGDFFEAKAEIPLKGQGTYEISGKWIVDGVSHPFSQKMQVAWQAVAKVSQVLPTNVSGDHTVELIVDLPTAYKSGIIKYTVSLKAPIAVVLDPVIQDATVSIDGTTKIKIKINVTQAGSFNLLGYLLLDGKVYDKLEKIVIGPGEFIYEMTIPAQSAGPHTVQFKLVSPAELLSNAVTFRVVGEAWVWPGIIYPGDGTTVTQNSPLVAELGIKVGGKGTIKVVGVWMIDDLPYRDYEQMLQITSETIILEKMPLPTDAPGWHRLKFRMTWPYYEETKEIWYRIWGREQPPSFLQVITHPQSPYSNYQSFQLQVRAQDDRGIKNLCAYVDFAKHVDVSMGGMMVIDYITPTIGPLTVGEHTWSVTLTDLDGLESEYIGKFVVTKSSGVLEGFVLNRITNGPIVDAEVSCAGHLVKTDAYGKYRIDGLGEGEQVVMATHQSYRSAEARVTIFAGVTTNAPTLYLDDKGPLPFVYQIEHWPQVPKTGESFVLSVYVRNDGADADLSEVAISCPEGAVIEIDPDTGAQYPSFAYVYYPGSFIDHRDGQQIRAIHPVAIVRWNSWGSGVTRKVMIKVSPQEPKPFNFWVRAMMSKGLSKEIFPRNSEIIDQQGYPIKEYRVEVQPK